MSVILLRVRGGLDYSAHIVDEELVEPEVVTVFSKIIVKIVIVIIFSIVIIVTIFCHLYIPQNLFPEDTALKRPEGLDRKISVEQAGKKKISVDRAQVMIVIMITIII